MQQRSENPVLPYLAAALIILFTPVLFVFGVIVYRIVRPHEKIGEVYERNLAEEALLAEVESIKTCPACRRRVNEEWIICPTLPHAAQPRVRQLRPPRRPRLVAVRLVRQGLRARRHRGLSSRSRPAAERLDRLDAGRRRPPARPRPREPPALGEPRAPLRRQPPSSRARAAPRARPGALSGRPRAARRARRRRARPRPTARRRPDRARRRATPGDAVPRPSTFSLEGRARPGAVPRRLGRVRHGPRGPARLVPRRPARGRGAAGCSSPGSSCSGVGLIAARRARRPSSAAAGTDLAVPRPVAGPRLPRRRSRSRCSSLIVVLAPLAALGLDAALAGRDDRLTSCSRCSPTSASSGCSSSGPAR